MRYPNALKPNFAFTSGYGTSPQAARFDDPRLGIAPGGSWMVDTVNGSDSNTGGSWAAAFKTMAKAFTAVRDNDRISFVGSIREQLLAPLGIQGVSIIGGAGGRTRHDDGARWYSPASPAATTPLLTLREQGWELHNILFVPPAGAGSPAVRWRRAEDATYPDGSHGIISGCKFVGGVTGVEDHGGAHHWLIDGCEFMGDLAGTAMTNAFTCVSGAGIAYPARHIIQNSLFRNVTNAIFLPGLECTIRGNFFEAGTLVVSTKGGGGKNWIIDNYFSDATADYDIGHGYNTEATDIWRNWVTDAAAPVVARPAA
jgi:hypothetical protein